MTLVPTALRHAPNQLRGSEAAKQLATLDAAVRTSEREQLHLAEQLELARSRLAATQRLAKVGSWETDLSTMSMIWSEETHRIHETDPATFRPAHADFMRFVHPE